MVTIKLKDWKEGTALVDYFFTSEEKNRLEARVAQLLIDNGDIPIGTIVLEVRVDVRMSIGTSTSELINPDKGTFTMSYNLDKEKK